MDAVNDSIERVLKPIVTALELRETGDAVNDSIERVLKLFTGAMGMMPHGDAVNDSIERVLKLNTAFGYPSRAKRCSKRLDRASSETSDGRRHQYHQQRCSKRLDRASSETFAALAAALGGGHDAVNDSIERVLKHVGGGVAD